MITEDYVGFETAKLLKEKGFDVYGDGSFNSGIEVFAEYSPSGTFNKCVTSKPHHQAYPTPTLQMAMKWLREEKKIGIEINTNFDCADGKWYYEYGFCIFQLYGTFEKLSECDYDGYKTYEEACEAAIKYCLEKLI